VENSPIFNATEQDFEDRVLAASRDVPVMVDFWADWCPPCRALTPVLERLAGEYGGVVRLAKVEVDDNMHLAGRYGLRGFPTVILFIQGKEAGRFSGFKPESQVRDFIDDLLESDKSAANP
jgi:thioredoxin 1